MSTPATFPAAVIAWLTSNGPAASAFGDSSAAPKFVGIQGFAAPDVPFARVQVVGGGTSTRESADGAGIVHYYLHGELQIDVFAADADDCESLGDLIIGALADPQLAWANGRTLELSLSAPPFFVPEPEAGPGVSAVYHRVHQFMYVNERTITP